MDLFQIVLGLVTGAEIVGATVSGKSTRLAVMAAAGVVSLALPDALDPAMALVEFMLLRRIG
ncbi:MAG: hypothetical protein IH968_13730 [Gemmatimonadetes bacterium]|nr:hypothetical protein [Gemmatimonadota bacterium]